MKAVFLLKPDGTKTDISICGECGTPARGETNFDLSQRCCTCYECGGDLPVGTRNGRSLYHPACEARRNSRADSDTAEKAVLVENYDGPVSCDRAGNGSYGDGYFSDVHELAECVRDKKLDVEFAFCCESRTAVVLDVDSILESATEEAFEDAIQGLNGIDDLRAAVEIFNEANAGVLTWDCDTTRKVRVPKAGLA